MRQELSCRGPLLSAPKIQQLPDFLFLWLLDCLAFKPDLLAFLEGFALFPSCLGVW